MPRLPLDEIDLLIVDRIGKNISGAGVDPNIINRSVHGYTSELARLGRSSPFIRRIFVRDLTPETKGNAIGIGFADITTGRVARKLDPASTFVNALTAMTPNGAKLPIHFETDLECINAALQSTGVPAPDQARIVHIADSLSLETIAVSLPCLPELRQNPALQLSGLPYSLDFDATGHLLSTPGPTAKTTIAG